MSHFQPLPDFFEPLLASQYAPDFVESIIEGTKSRRRVTLRANTLLSNADEVAHALDAASLAHVTPRWYRDAFVLAEAREPAIRVLDVYEQGKIYLQNLSAMLPPLVLDAAAGHDVCDMCAAPGGKTTQILALADGKAYVTACEMHAPRAQKLEHNLEKLGARNVTVLKTDARRLDEFFSFDRILLDAPCSGSGTLRTSDPKLFKRFTPKLVEKSMKAQRALITKALSLLRPGGVLVYSTCSVLRSENEEIVEWGLEKCGRRSSYEIMAIERSGFDDLPHLPTSIDGTLCLHPDDTYEGFFVAKIKRSG